MSKNAPSSTATTTRASLWTTAALTLVVCTSVMAATDAPSVPATDTYHGVAVADPFRNLEDLKAPATRQWLEAQAKAAAATLARIDGRAALGERIAALANDSGDRTHGFVRRGPRVFFMKRAAGESQFKLIVRRSAGGAERVLVDPLDVGRASGTPHAINWFVPSWDGRTIAYGISAAGSEDASLYLMDVDSGRSLREPISRVSGELQHWSPDSRFVTFNRLRERAAGAPEADTYADSTVFVLDRAHPQREPRALFGRLVQGDLGLERLDAGEVRFAPGSRWMLARTTDTTVPEGKLFVAPLSQLQAPRVAWRQISDAAAKITEMHLRGDTLYFRSYLEAPRGQVRALRLHPKAVLAEARVVVPEPERGVLETFDVGARALYTSVQTGFGSRVVRHEIDRPGPGVDAAPALAGSTFMLVDRSEDREDLWLITSTWTEPSRVLAVLPRGKLRDTGLRNNRRPESMGEIEVTQTEVESHDGARVPVAVLHRKGLALDGRNPALLEGYGAYGQTITAWFDARRWAWLERGGVLAYVNPRGSGAFGDAWYRAGFKASKPNTWKDGVAAARWLIARGYATPATLGVIGTSAGGIFVGRAVTSAPELFAAAIFNVGVLDTVRFEFTANGATNVSENGTVAIESEFKALLEMSTYHQIRDNTAYPAVLLVHGMNDPRVDAWQSVKTAARLQQATSSGKPVLLRLDTQAGHGMGSTAQQAQSQLADTWAFLLWQFGRAALGP